MERKEQLLVAVFGTMRSKQEVIVTSRRPHVATSGQQRRSQQFSKSRCHHVATSLRRDVSSKICISSLNARRLGIEGIGKRTRRGTEFQSQRIQTSRECPGFVPLSIFFRNYLGYDDDVFEIRYFVLFFHDVLDLFLGLHQTLSQTMD